MRLFKRKHGRDEAAVRCPNCYEHVPKGVRECTMCGHSVADVVDRVGGWSAPARTGEPTSPAGTGDQ